LQPSGSSTDAAGEWLDEDDGGAAVERLEELRQELTAKIAAVEMGLHAKVARAPTHPRTPYARLALRRQCAQRRAVGQHARPALLVDCDTPRCPQLDKLIGAVVTNGGASDDT
jgi:hypothetical protein